MNLSHINVGSVKEIFIRELAKLKKSNCTKQIENLTKINYA
jgi:hypothetical protein